MVFIGIDLPQAGTVFAGELNLPSRADIKPRRGLPQFGVPLHGSFTTGLSVSQRRYADTAITSVEEMSTPVIHRACLVGSEFFFASRNRTAITCNTSNILMPNHM